MMRTLLINSSPHGAASHAFNLAREAIGTLDGEVLERDLVAHPLPPIGRDYASAITSRDPSGEAFVWSERVIRELEHTDVLVISTPMHNFTVPAALKLWIDHVLRINRTFEATSAGKVGLMRDRPTFVLVGSGGFHCGDRARQPDFLSPYLRYALASIGIRSVNFVFLQGLVGGDAAVADALIAARATLSDHAPFQHLAKLTARAD